MAWYSLFAHARNIPGFYGIRKITNIYRTLSTYTNRICSFYVVDRQRRLSFAVCKAGKEGIVLEPEQLQAVRHIYEARDVFLWLPTTFGKSICNEMLPFLLDCKLGKTESSIVIVVSPLVSLIVDQVASLRSHDLQI